MHNMALKLLKYFYLLMKKRFLGHCSKVLFPVYQVAGGNYSLPQINNAIIKTVHSKAVQEYHVKSFLLRKIIKLNLSYT